MYNDPFAFAVWSVSWIETYLSLRAERFVGTALVKMPSAAPYPYGPLDISIVGEYVHWRTTYPGLIGQYVFGEFSASLGSTDGAQFYLEREASTIHVGNPLSAR